MLTKQLAIEVTMNGVFPKLIRFLIIEARKIKTNGKTGVK